MPAWSPKVESVPRKESRPSTARSKVEPVSIAPPVLKTVTFGRTTSAPDATTMPSRVSAAVGWTRNANRSFAAGPFQMNRLPSAKRSVPFCR